MCENEDFKIYEHLWQVSKFHINDVFSPHSLFQSKVINDEAEWSLAPTKLIVTKYQHNLHFHDLLSLAVQTLPVKISMYMSYGKAYTWYDVSRSVDLLLHIPTLHVTSYHVYALP